MSSNPYSAPQASLQVQAEASPPIWNPGAATAWSLLFTPIFGAWVHMKNWEALGKPKEAATAQRWLIGNVLFLVVLIGLTMWMPQSSAVGFLGRFGGFIVLMVWYAMSGKDQIEFVTYGYGKQYVRRGWGKPIAYGILAYIVLFFVAAIFGIILAAAAGKI
ncbi:MAG: hypothetical protein V4631_03960 [Pseudomonadota bacterium]